MTRSSFIPAGVAGENFRYLPVFTNRVCPRSQIGRVSTANVIYHSGDSSWQHNAFNANRICANVDDTDRNDTDKKGSDLKVPKVSKNTFMI